MNLPNRNILIGVIALLFFGVGTLYYLLGAGGSPASLNRSGELTRNLAEQIIWDELKDRPESFLAGYLEYEKGYSSPSGGLSMGMDKLDEVKNLESLGLVKIVQVSGTIIVYDFTDEGRKYTSLAEYNPNGKNLTVHVAYPKNIEVTGIAKRGETEAVVDYEIDFTLTPFGEVITPELKDTQKRGATLKLYDDGWRY